MSYIQLLIKTLQIQICVFLLDCFFVLFFQAIKVEIRTWNNWSLCWCRCGRRSITTSWINLNVVDCHIGCCKLHNTLPIKLHVLQDTKKKKLLIMMIKIIYRPVDRAVTRSEEKVWVSNTRPVKLDIVLPMACHRCNVSSKGALLPWLNDAEMAQETRYTLGRNTTNIMKDLIRFDNDNTLPTTINKLSN